MSILKFYKKEEDDMLLRTLFKERHCSLSIISSVFNLDEEEISSRLKELKLKEV